MRMGGAPLLPMVNPMMVMAQMFMGNGNAIQARQTSVPSISANTTSSKSVSSGPSKTAETTKTVKDPRTDSKKGDGKPASKPGKPRCTHHYRGSCRKGDDCAFSHDPKIDVSKDVRRHLQTIYCIDLARFPGCHRGEACLYSHDAEKTPPEKKVCKYFRAGDCKRGTGCDFKHVSDKQTHDELNAQVNDVLAPFREQESRAASTSARDSLGGTSSSSSSGLIPSTPVAETSVVASKERKLFAVDDELRNFLPGDLDDNFCDDMKPLAIPADVAKSDAENVEIKVEVEASDEVVAESDAEDVEIEVELEGSDEEVAKLRDGTIKAEIADSPVIKAVSTPSSEPARSNVSKSSGPPKRKRDPDESECTSTVDLDFETSASVPSSPKKLKVEDSPDMWSAAKATAVIKSEPVATPPLSPVSTGDAPATSFTPRSPKRGRDDDGNVSDLELPGSLRSLAQSPTKKRRANSIQPASPKLLLREASSYSPPRSKSAPGTPSSFRNKGDFSSSRPGSPKRTFEEFDEVETKPSLQKETKVKAECSSPKLRKLDSGAAMAVSPSEGETLDAATASSVTPAEKKPVSSSSTDAGNTSAEVSATLPEYFDVNVSSTTPSKSTRTKDTPLSVEEVEQYIAQVDRVGSVVDVAKVAFKLAKTEKDKSKAEQNLKAATLKFKIVRGKAKAQIKERKFQKEKFSTNLRDKIVEKFNIRLVIEEDNLAASSPLNSPVEINGFEHSTADMICEAAKGAFITSSQKYLPEPLTRSTGVLLKHTFLADTITDPDED
jgi:hypothetical protein